MKKGLLLVALSAVVLLGGCAQEEEGHSGPSVVQVTPVQPMDYEVGLDYLGLVTARDTKRYSFLSGGQLEELYVREGDTVASGDPLASLDTTQLELTVSTSSNSIQIAENSIATLTESLETARSALETAQRNLERYEALYEAGAASLVEVENMQLQVDSQRASCAQMENDLASAQSSLSNSRLAKQQAQENLANATLVADCDGIVMELPYEPGEVVGSGAPVVIVKSASKVITVGVSADDISKVTLASTIRIDGEIDGRVDKIGQYPDEALQAYPVEIVLDSDRCAIGDMVDVRIVTGTSSAGFVPVQSIFNVDGLDYVYIVGEDGLVSRRQVIRRTISEDMVGVDGLEDGMSVICDGIKAVKENEIVTAVPRAEADASGNSETAEPSAS